MKPGYAIADWHPAALALMNAMPSKGSLDFYKELEMQYTTLNTNGFHNQIGLIGYYKRNFGLY